MSDFRTIEDVWGYLEGIPMFSKVGRMASNFGLTHIKHFCAKIGNPQNQLRTIHVAGTNGKGTVTLLLDYIYTQAGYITGAFTSPHLMHYNERVKLLGKDISNHKILEFFQNFESELKEVPLTYFELSTALAFWAFKDAGVDIAIIEAGLGGRLDSTNIINPECAVITSIGLDHESILGNTKAAIASEKAGIIKSGIPVVLGNIDGEALDTIEKKAQMERASIIYSMDQKPSFKNGEVRVNSVQESFKTSFIEPINASNIATVVSVIQTLQAHFKVNHSLLVDAIETFKGVPARFEQLNAVRNWYFSGAHNTDAIKSLVETIAQFSDRRVYLILSFMKDKVSTETMGYFKEFKNAYFYQQNAGRAAKLEEISEYLIVSEIDNSNFKRILNELKHEVVIFAGSFYFYPIVKRWLTQLN